MQYKFPTQLIHCLFSEVSASPTCIPSIFSAFSFFSPCIYSFISSCNNSGFSTSVALLPCQNLLVFIFYNALASFQHFIASGSISNYYSALFALCNLLCSLLRCLILMWTWSSCPISVSFHIHCMFRLLFCYFSVVSLLMHYLTFGCSAIWCFFFHLCTIIHIISYVVHGLLGSLLVFPWCLVLVCLWLC